MTKKKRHKNRSFVVDKKSTFSPSASFSKKSVSGDTYCERLLILLVLNKSIPDPVKSIAVTLNLHSSKSAIVLYQHQAPKPPP